MGHMKEWLLTDHPHGGVPREACGLCQRDALRARGARNFSPVRPAPATSPPSDVTVPLPTRPAGGFSHDDAYALATSVLWLRRRHEDAMARLLTTLVEQYDPALMPVVMIGWIEVV